MMDLRTQTLNRLRTAEQATGAAKAAKWLMANGTQPLSADPIEVRVRDVLELWRTRLSISASKGHTIDGAPELLETLQNLHPHVKLEQIGFTGFQRMGNIFFKKTNKEFVGSVIFDTPEEQREFQRAS